MVRGEIRRQEARATERHHPSVEPGSVQEGAARQGEAAEAAEAARLPRAGLPLQVYSREVLSLDLARTTLQLLALAALILSSFWIVRPFLVASTWAVMIAVATWPLLLGLQARLAGRRSLAVAVMTIALLLVLLVPFYFGVTAIVEHAGQIGDWTKSLATFSVPPPPGWVAGIPVIGSRLTVRWQQLASA